MEVRWFADISVSGNSIVYFFVPLAEKKITESTSGCDGSYQFLRAAGAPVRRRRAAGRGPPRHAKIDFFFCSREPFTKIFLKRKPRENLTKTLRKSHENAWIPIENACFLSKKRFNTVFAEKKISTSRCRYYLNHAQDNSSAKDASMYSRTGVS